MTYTVSITSQGQISIPSKLRRELGLEKIGKAQVFQEGNRIIIEPIKDFLQLGGSLKTKIKASPGKIRRAFEGYLAKEAVIHAKA